MNPLQNVVESPGFVGGRKIVLSHETGVAQLESVKHLMSDKPVRRPNRTRPLQTVRVQIIVYDAEEGGFWAEVPSLPGCVSEGETLDETLGNVREALEGVLLSYRDAGEPIPWEKGEASQPGGQVRWLDVDLESLV